MDQKDENDRQLDRHHNSKQLVPHSRNTYAHFTSGTHAHLQKLNRTYHGYGNIPHMAKLAQILLVLLRLLHLTSDYARCWPDHYCGLDFCPSNYCGHCLLLHDRVWLCSSFLFSGLEHHNALGNYER